MTLLLVIPCLNEETHLPSLLDALCADPAAAASRIVVVDGGSTDASQRLVRERAERDARIVLMVNAKRIQSAGVNHAVHAYGGDAELYLWPECGQVGSSSCRRRRPSLQAGMRLALAPNAPSEGVGDRRGRPG